MSELMIKIDNVSKQYRLGAIGGRTLQGDFESWWAKKRGKDDPNLKIGSKVYEKNETFLALDGVSFGVKKGERVGIIGHNGAGKSTLLKLLCRVTAPSKGEIGLNGRITSMLEVGTGFNGELTGRENIYMNGAILGMTKKEIDSKIEDIIEFSECRQFIDTPVKRYSSGMYVKLAFAVAAHLDSEIMIMDEVLAVGDMAFQKKCLEKMSDVSKSDGRTILYVSHNMNTIRQLCDRCIVIEHGKKVFDGDVESAIKIYLRKNESEELATKIVYGEGYQRKNVEKGILFQRTRLLNRSNPKCFSGEMLEFVVNLRSERDWENINLRFEIQANDSVFATCMSDSGMDIKCGRNYSVKFAFNTTHIVKGKYQVSLVAFQYDDVGNELLIDGVYPGFYFEIEEKINTDNKLVWETQWWGNIHLQDVMIIEVSETES